VCCVRISGKKLLSIFFFDCPSSATRWFALGVIWNEGANIHEKLQIARQGFIQPFFMEIVMIGAWCIWNERNALIFNGKAPSLASWKADFKKEVVDHFCRIKPTLHQSIQSWLDAL
jgi:hypothetical protein